jgi:hypothetical protein
MKRSARFYMKARRAALWGAAWISAVMAGCVWSVRVMQESASGGVACFLVALAGLFWASGLIREAMRLARLGRNEEQWENRSSIRPRI